MHMTNRPHPLTRWLVLYNKVIDKVPQLVHLPAVLTVDHLQVGVDPREGKPVVAFDVELLELVLDLRDGLIPAVAREIVSMGSNHHNWRVLCTALWIREGGREG